MTALPAASVAVPESIRAGLALAASAWFDDPERPRLSKDMLARWDELLVEWCAAADLPLLIRKARGNRGRLLQHISGRLLVPTDNSPAHWTLALAYADCCPSLDEVRAMFRADRIPVAMVISAAERAEAAYKCTRQSAPGPNQQGWKVAHIDNVGLGYVDMLENVSIDMLCSHFRRFLSPANMFLVPKAYAGIAETPEFVEAFRSRAHASAP